MGLIIDPVGDSRRRYRKKILDVRKKGGKMEYVSLPVIKDGRIKRYKIPIIPIDHLEYGPRENNPGSSREGGYPGKGQGAPAIGSGPGLPGKGGRKKKNGKCPGCGGCPGHGPSDNGVPGPGSGVPGTPVYPPIGDEDGLFGGDEEVDPVYEEMEKRELLRIMEEELELEMIKPGKHKKKKKIIYPAISHYGDDSLFNLDETIMAMQERQLVEAPMYKKLEERMLKKIENKKSEFEKKRLSIQGNAKLKEKTKKKKIKALEKKYRDVIQVLEEKLSKIRNKLEEVTFEKGKMKIKIEEDDLRYNFPKIKYEYDKDAVVVYIRDVSGSITKDHLRASYEFTELIDMWLEKFYPKVERVYIAHNAWAWEETPEGYKKLQSDGGTKFAPAYEILLAMIEGREYETKMPELRKIDASSKDIYVVQMTDGESFDSHEIDTDPLAKLMPDLTRFCYLEEKIDYFGYDSGYMDHLKSRFAEEYASGKVRTYMITDIKDMWGPMRAFFGKRR